MTTDQKTSPYLHKQITQGLTGMDIKTKYGLYDHQVDGVKFLIDKKKAICAYSMGLGKTKLAIVAAVLAQKKRALVICPASLKINWQREILKWVDEESHIISGGSAQRFEDVPWVIINYDILDKHKYALKGAFDTIIIDECHYVKDDSTIRSKAVLELVPTAERVYLLTGTPMLNRPIELYPLLRAVGHPLGAPRAKTAFAVRYCGAKKKTVVQDLHSGKRFFTTNPFIYTRDRRRYRVFTFMDMKGATNLVELRESLKSVMQRRLKKDAIDLPEKIHTTHYVELTPEQRRTYDTAFDEYISWLALNPDPEKDLQEIIMAKHLVEIQKVKQVCSLAKVDRVIEDVKNAVEQGEKVIVFSQYTKTIQTIHEAIGKESVTLTGADTSESRQHAVDSFQNDPNIKVFIGNIKAGGVGITLTAASIVMFADMEWSPGVHDQAEDRAHRIGQNGTVNVYYYVAEGTIEEDIMDMLSKKREVIQAVIDGATDGVRMGGMQSELMQRMRDKFSTA